MIKDTRFYLYNLRLLEARLGLVVKNESVEKFLTSSVGWFLAVVI